MTASCESVTDLMLPNVSGNSPSTLCTLLIEFVLVVVVKMMMMLTFVYEGMC